MVNLKKLRLSRGLSQQSLAQQLNTSQQSIYKYENQITEPSIDMLINMASFFDVSVDYLIGFSSYAHTAELVQEASLNKEELTLLQKYRSLPRSSQTVVQKLMDELLQNLT